MSSHIPPLGNSIFLAQIKTFAFELKMSFGILLEYIILLHLHQLNTLHVFMNCGSKLMLQMFAVQMEMVRFTTKE